MKKTIFSVSIAFLLLGCGEDYERELRGRLTLEDSSHPLVLRGHLGETRSFNNGPVSIAYEDRSSFESSTFVIRQGNSGVALLLPKREFINDRQFYFHGARIGQEVDIEGRFDLTNVGDPYYRDVVLDCSYSGFCWHQECDTSCTPVTDTEGEVSVDCDITCSDDWGWSSECPGYRVSRLKGQEKRYVTRIRFLESGSNAQMHKVADFSHEHEIFTDEENYRELLACVEDPSDSHNHFVPLNTSPRTMPERYRGEGRFSTPE